MKQMDGFIKRGWIEQWHFIRAKAKLYRKYISKGELGVFLWIISKGKEVVIYA
jgi:hypothetical protein